jgi:hypothetical protein
LAAHPLRANTPIFYKEVRMSPKPITPEDEIEYVNDAGIRKKKGKSGNSKKRRDYFLQQRFPFLEPLAEEDRDQEPKPRGRAIRKKSTVEEQQAVAAPLARVRAAMMQEYKRRLLAQQQALEQAAAQKARTEDNQQ